jgi:hypothetical protein
MTIAGLNVVCAWCCVMYRYENMLLAVCAIHSRTVTGRRKSVTGQQWSRSQRFSESQQHFLNIIAEYKGHATLIFKSHYYCILSSFNITSIESSG